MNRRRLVYPLLVALAAATVLVFDRLRGGHETPEKAPVVPALPERGSGATSIGPAPRPAKDPAAATAPAPSAPAPAPTAPPATGTPPPTSPR